MTHTRELHMVTKNEREIEGYFCHRLRRNKKTERKKRERKREEREKERKTQRQRGRQREKRQEGEKERWFLLPQTPQKQNKNNNNSFSVMMREPPPPSKLLYSLETKARKGDGEVRLLSTNKSLHHGTQTQRYVTDEVRYVKFGEAVRPGERGPEPTATGWAPRLYRYVPFA